MSGGWTRRAALRGFGVGLGLPWLAACGSTPESRAFTLAPQPGAAARRGPAVVNLRTAAIPKYLDRPQIVRYGSPYRLDLSEFDRWAEPLRDMITRVTAENLRQRLPDSRILTENRTAQPPVVGVEIDLSRFERDPGGEVVLLGRWLLTRGGALNAGPGIELRQMPGSGIEGIVAAMSALLGQFSDALASELAAA